MVLMVAVLQAAVEVQEVQAMDRASRGNEAVTVVLVDIL
jgi:hypothetical protein